MKHIDLYKQAQTQHKAFLIDSEGYIENIFIYDNEDFEFVSGYLYELSGEGIENINNLSIKELQKELNKIELYTLIGMSFLCKMYVKWDGSSHIWFYDEDEEKVDYLYFGNIIYKKWIKSFLFVHEIVNILYREKGGEYGIENDDWDVKELKELLFRNHKIVIIKNDTSVKINS